MFVRAWAPSLVLYDTVNALSVRQRFFCHIYNGKCVSLAQFLNLLSLSASLPILLIYSKKRVIVCISFPRESRNFTSKIVWLVIFHSDIGYVTLSFFETQKKCYKESIHLFCWPRWKILTILSFPIDIFSSCQLGSTCVKFKAGTRGAFLFQPYHDNFDV